MRVAAEALEARDDPYLDGHATEADKLNTSGSDLDDDGAADHMLRHKASGGGLAATIAPKSATARTRTSRAPYIPARHRDFVGQEAEALKASAKLTKAAHVKQQSDLTKDWLLSDKDFSPKLVKQLLGMVASLGLTTSFQAKVNRSSIIDPIQVDNRDSRIQGLLELIKTALSDYHKVMKAASKGEQEKAFPPFVVVWITFVNWLANVAPPILVGQVEDLAVVSRYATELAALPFDSQVTLVLDQVRYARTRGTYAKRLTLIEVGVGCLAPESAKFWSVAKKVLKMGFKGRARAGIAPKSGIERRIEATLKRLKIWHTANQ
jgi:hypothetical protein